MKSVRPLPPVYEMISQKIFFFTIDGFPKYNIAWPVQSFLRREPLRQHPLRPAYRAPTGWPNCVEDVKKGLKMEKMK